MKENLFNLQLFAEGEEGLTIDQALDVINGNEATEPELTTEPEAAPVVEEHQEASEPAAEPQEEQQEPVAEEKPSVDYTAKIKFKANGQEQEKSIQELINEAQLASNYNQKMQELAMQRKAFELAQQQKPPEDKPEDKLKTLQQQVDDYAAKFQQQYGVEFNPYDPAHQAAFAQNQMEERVKAANEQAQRESFEREVREVEGHYTNLVQSYAKEPDFLEVNKSAEQALFMLPQSGSEGITEFQELYPIYQNLKARDQYAEEMQQYGRSNVQIQPLTRKQVEKLSNFYEKCKADYVAHKAKQETKEKVPRSAPIKPTVQVEKTSPSEAPAARKVDYKKLQSMDLDDIAKLL